MKPEFKITHVLDSMMLKSSADIRELLGANGHPSAANTLAT